MYHKVYDCDVPLFFCLYIMKKIIMIYIAKDLSFNYNAMFTIYWLEDYVAWSNLKLT